MRTIGFVAQISLRSDFPLHRTDLAYGLCLGGSKRSEAVENRGADLEFRDLSIEVTRGEALAEQFHTIHPLPGRVLRSNVPRGLSQRGFGGGIRSAVATVPAPDILRIEPLRFALWLQACLASTAWRSCAAGSRHGHYEPQSRRGICACRKPHPR